MITLGALRGWSEMEPILETEGDPITVLHGYKAEDDEDSPEDAAS